MNTTTLAGYVERGRDNNFNLLRFVAAMLVLFSHSFALSLGTGQAEPLRHALGMTPGTIAVDIFFVTSGFLVTRSLMSRKDVLEFILARVLRIYPALIASVLVTVAVVGWYFNKDSYAAFLSARSTMSFIVQNCVSLFDTVFTLPGVFETNPYKATVNGSLWTLPMELKMYGCLLALWVGFSVCVNDTNKYCAISIILVPVAALLLYFRKYGFQFYEQSALRLMYMFFVGGAYYSLKEYVPLSSRIAYPLIVIILASAVFVKSAYFVVYIVAFPYVVLYLAYVPSGAVRSFNALGDYSYGLYIYGFPVQQMFAAAIKPIGVGELFVYSAGVSLLLAFISWHGLEKRALGLKNGSAQYLRSLKLKRAWKVD